MRRSYWGRCEVEEDKWEREGGMESRLMYEHCMTTDSKWGVKEILWTKAIMYQENEAEVFITAWGMKEFNT